MAYQIRLTRYEGFWEGARKRREAEVPRGSPNWPRHFLGSQTRPAEVRTSAPLSRRRTASALLGSLQSAHVHIFCCLVPSSSGTRKRNEEFATTVRSKSQTDVPLLAGCVPWATDTTFGVRKWQFGGETETLVMESKQPSLQASNQSPRAVNGTIQ